jgi:hypothetical protein
MICPVITSEVKTRRSNKNLILDIDNTCVNTFEEYNSKKLAEFTSDLKEYDLRASIYVLRLPSGENLYGIYRGYLRFFLSWAFSTFANVIFWTAGTKEYAEAIVSDMCHGIGEPTRILSRGDCVPHGRSYTKPLFKILDDTIRLDNTLFLDDNSLYMMFNNGNSVLIPKKCDYRLMEFINWFNKENVGSAHDVRKLDKSLIFGKESST